MDSSGKLALKIPALILLVIGIILISFSLFVGTVMGIWLVFFLLGLIPLVIGIILILLYDREQKRTSKNLAQN